MATHTDAQLSSLSSLISVMNQHFGAAADSGNPVPAGVKAQISSFLEANPMDEQSLNSFARNCFDGLVRILRSEKGTAENALDVCLVVAAGLETRGCDSRAKEYVAKEAISRLQDLAARFCGVEEGSAGDLLSRSDDSAAPVVSPGEAGAVSALRLANRLYRDYVKPMVAVRDQQRVDAFAALKVPAKIDLHVVNTGC